ncbi:uncharacterized protein BYT42DRAFT_491154 [Radiomyces spectabilis]|uniref:uncharacterized protein n=1 Tax=Radiomyces spectabilis TaxID=64574 RepID=UPI00221F08A4|nr:uncharacterized protein BYT42DRAFT_491154 [Radiomyces spectabilis]KAI8388909.1 hypothetical protein BYT42DRAFT_491154 [Radiomyces spectabilis]
MAASATRTQVLSLYREFLRYGNQFSSYNFRDYAIRRSRDAFRSQINETNPEKITECIQKAKKELEMVRRQATISSLYSRGDRLVIEKRV